MPIIKSFSVGCGDMYYIRHASDNFTIIDCMLPADGSERCDQIVGELEMQSCDKEVVRFISTHPDQDHVRGLRRLDERMRLRNFYCVKNATIKDEPSDDFAYYCELRDDKKKSFYISQGCSRKWMNKGDETRGAAGLSVIWPDVSNAEYQAALKCAEEGGSPNNTSAIIKYSLKDGLTALWMGDLETDFMERITTAVQLPAAHLLFAPHHGRESGRVPESWLEKIEPTVIVLGEAPSEHIHYYPRKKTITQNSAGDITFNCRSGRVDVHVSNQGYQEKFLKQKTGADESLGRYIGSFDV